MLRGRPLDPNNPFEVDLAEALGEAMRRDESVAVGVYRALCNVEWERADEQRYSCTWRSASELISGIRAQGEHDLDWYLSGDEGIVDPRIEEALAARGWRPLVPANRS